jgi:NAD(P)-dependent dehydrogenase (short-subunit alcohol dehydrogenase family)
MSKHALVAMTHATRFAGWDDQLRATALCPGAVETELVRNVPGAVPGPSRIEPATIAETVARACDRRARGHKPQRRAASQ